MAWLTSSRSNCESLLRRRGTRLWSFLRQKEEKENQAEHHRSQAGRLRVGHTKERSRIQADDFDQKSRNAGQNEICAEDSARRLVGFKKTAADAPQNKGDQHPRDELVERRRMNTLGRWHHAVREAHAPGQTGRNAVVAVAAEEAPDSADRIADTGCRRTSVEKGQ